MRAAFVERVRVGIVSAPPELFMEPNVADRILELVWDVACTGEASNRDVERAHSPATNAEACIANSSA